MKADFPNLVKNDEVSSADALAYTTKGTFPIYAYAFNNNALAASTLMISTEMDDKDSLGEWSEQYYAYYNDTEMGMLYGNAKSIDDATVLVEFRRRHGRLHGHMDCQRAHQDRTRRHDHRPHTHREEPRNRSQNSR